MQFRRARTHSLRLTTTVVAVVALSGLVAVPGFAADEAEVYLVQGLPGLKVDVSIDGRTVARDVATTAIAGPFEVSGGQHRITIAADGDEVLNRTFTAKARSSSGRGGPPAGREDRPADHDHLRQRPECSPQGQGVTDGRAHGGSPDG